MAQGGPIERQDIITDDAIMAPQIMTKELEKLVDSMEKVRASAIQQSKAIADTDSIKKVGDAHAQLSKEQEQYVKIQNQIATVVSKTNDQYYAFEAQLKRVKEEQKQGSAAADQWVKQATVQNSSLVKLEDALNKNRIAYANLRTEQDRNSKSGHDLLAVIQQQDKGVKAIRDSMGQAQGHVGGYREEIEKLLPGLKSIAPEAVLAGEAVAGFGTKLLAAVLSGPALIITGIAAAFTIAGHALETFFDRTIEGEDTATKVAGDWSAAVEVVKDKFAALGKAISTTLGLQDHAVAGFISMTLQMAGLGGLAADYLKKTVQEAELSETIIEIRKEELTIGQEIAEQEKRKNKDLFDARDKLRQSDQDRFNAALDSRNAIQEEIALKLKQNDLEQKEAKLQIEAGKDNYQAEQKLSDLKVKRIQIEQEQFQGQRRTLQLLGTIADEAVKNELNSQKAIEEASQKAQESKLQDVIDVNSRIIGNQDFSVEEQIKAQTKLTNAQIALTGLSQEKQTESVRSSAIDRVKLTSEELDTIFKESEGDLSKLVQLTINKNNEKFSSDKGYLEESKAIQEEQASNERKLIRDEVNKKAKIYIDNQAYFLGLHEKFLKEDQQVELKGLNKEFEEGKITLYEYTKEKARILSGGGKEAREAQLVYYDQQIADLKKYVNTTVSLTQEQRDKILALISDLENKETALTDAGAAARIAKISKTFGVIRQLETDFVDGVLNVAIQFNQNLQDALNQRIQQLQDQSQKEQDLAGDNANAKVQIEKSYNKKIEDEQKKLRKLQHDQAVYERDIAAVKIAIDIAEAIAKLYATFPIYVAIPLSVLLGAIGVAQEVALFSKPIPAYEKGRRGGPGEYAIVGEKGAEIVQEPSGRMRLYDTPGASLTYLQPGSNVYTAEETQAIIERNIFNDSFRDSRMLAHQAQAARGMDDKRILENLDRNFDKLIRSNPNLVEQWMNVYRVVERRNGNRKLINSKIGNFE